MESTPRRAGNAAESIIFTQSALLMCFGLSGWLASSTVVAGFHAMTDVNSAAYFITDNKVVTENTSISTEDAESIINNFELVCVTSLIIGASVLLASIVRLAKRSRTSVSSTSSTNASKLQRSTSSVSSKPRAPRVQKHPRGKA